MVLGNLYDVAWRSRGTGKVGCRAQESGMKVDFDFKPPHSNCERLNQVIEPGEDKVELLILK